MLSDKIKFYSEHRDLISPFNPENLKPAAYELTIGDEYYLGGQYHFFDPESSENTLTIAPFEVVVIKTRETICLPRFLIARWNIRVRHAYSGLLWVGGPQVDPGYRGHLFCPLYNLSDKPAVLPIGLEIAAIDFVKTTPFDPSNPSDDPSYRYPLPKRPIIEEFGVEGMKSALYTQAGQRIDEFSESIASTENEIKLIQGRVLTFSTITFAVLAVVVSSLAVLFENTPGSIAISTSAWGSAVMAAATFSVALAIFHYYGTKRLQQRNLWAAGLFVAVLFAIFVGLASFYFALREIERLQSIKFEEIELKLDKKILNMEEHIIRNICEGRDIC